MDSTILSRRWIRVALVYFVTAVCLGVYMGASHDFRLRGVHVHVNMLGWVSAAVTGCVYFLFPQAAATRLARVHFWLYNLALPVMMASLAGLYFGQAGAEPVIGVSSVCMLLAVAAFAFNVWRYGGHIAVAKPAG
jgi:cbb3-type cytochrome oxidase subunit 1